MVTSLWPRELGDEAMLASVLLIGIFAVFYFIVRVIWF
jgi:hypothetical protein